MFMKRIRTEGVEFTFKLMLFPKTKSWGYISVRVICRIKYLSMRE